MSNTTTSTQDSALNPQWITGNQSFASITQKICEIPETPLLKTPKEWLLLFGLMSTIMMILGGVIGYLFWEGVGIWGITNPVGWGWAIVNFVFWIGIGHAGTLISAILFLFRQRWRTSINRFAEAMTIFAVMTAGMFPGIHVGRPWLAYFMFPVPNQMRVWPNFRSPLMWDVFAVNTYFIVSLIFWYVGMVPDLGTLRDRATNKVRKCLYGLASMGWRGSNRQWNNYEKAYLILAGISTPLVLSVHSVVSYDFATSMIPGWHTTIFPPYFVAGAIFSGFAMVMTLALIARWFYGLQDIITIRHLENMNKIMLFTGSLVGYAYGCEMFTAWYSGNEYEWFAFKNRATGQYAWAYWTMITCNVVVPQAFWFKWVRTNLAVMFVISILINVGMWFERFVIIVTSLAQDFMPSAWDYFVPTVYDVLIFIGSFGMFLSLFLLFIRFLPMVAMAEVKAILPQADPHYTPVPDESEKASRIELR